MKVDRSKSPNGLSAQPPVDTDKVKRGKGFLNTIFAILPLVISFFEKKRKPT